MIKPSIGRIVWFQPSKSEDQPFRDQPLAAIVTYVWGDQMVNLTVFDQAGAPFSATSVKLLQDDEEKPVFGYFAEWMPYQKGQAAKTETLEAKLTGAAPAA